MTPSPPQIRLYERPDCHLCEQALAGIEALAAEGMEFELLRIDIDSDDELLLRHLERIPVIELNGEFVCDLGLDEERLRSRLATVSA